MATMSSIGYLGCAAAIRGRLAAGEIDAVTFTSSSTVRNFMAALGPKDTGGWLERARVVAIGPITAETAAELGVRVDAIADDHSIPGLLAALVALLGDGRMPYAEGAAPGKSAGEVAATCGGGQER